MVIIFNENRRIFFYGLRWKLFILYFMISVIPLLIFSNVIYRNLDDYFRSSSKKEYLNLANVISTEITKSKLFNDESLKENFDMLLSEKSKEGGRILVINNSGVVINDSNKTEIGKTYVLPELIYALEKKDEAKVYKDLKKLYASATIVDEYSSIIGAVLVVASLDENFFVLEEIEKNVLILTIFIATIVAFLVFFTSKLMIDPLKNFLKIVEKMSEGRLEQRISQKGNNEFSDLANAFNNMAEKLEQVEHTREEFVSNVSHELKTPLSSIKVLTESILLQENVPTVMYNEFLQDINSEIDRMTDIVNDLLTLVKLDQKEMSMNLKEIELNSVVENIVKRLNPIAEQKNIELKYEFAKKVSIDADEVKLALAISNLIENGIKYTDREGLVKVFIDSDHQNAFLTVQDNGIGIAEEEQSKIFNRFYRIDKTRDRETGGSGLGLSITHSTILLHNGSIKVSSKENEGSIFVVRIPIHYSN